jgi:hypothetical protein
MKSTSIAAPNLGTYWVCSEANIREYWTTLMGYGKEGGKQKTCEPDCTLRWKGIMIEDELENRGGPDADTELDDRISAPSG